MFVVICLWWVTWVLFACGGLRGFCLLEFYVTVAALLIWLFDGLLKTCLRVVFIVDFWLAVCGLWFDVWGELLFTWLWLDIVVCGCLAGCLTYLRAVTGCWFWFSVVGCGVYLLIAFVCGWFVFGLFGDVRFLAVVWVVLSLLTILACWLLAGLLA